MSYGEKFRLEFADLQGNPRLLQISQKNYTGVKYPLIGTDEPVVIRWHNKDDFYNPIIGSTCTLNLMVVGDSGGEFWELVDKNWELTDEVWSTQGGATISTLYDDFYKSDEREYKVQISTGDVSGSPQWDTEETEFQSKNITWDDPLGTGFEFYWEGFLVVDQSKQLIMTEPYPIQIVASDQLGLLEGYTAPDSAITLDSSNEISMSSQSNFDSLFYYIRKILELTGLDFNIYIANNIRTSGSNFLDNQTIFHNIEFYEYGFLTDSFANFNAKELLSLILKSFNSRIFQSQGRWYIISNSNLIDERIFTQGLINPTILSSIPLILVPKSVMVMEGDNLLIPTQVLNPDNSATDVAISATPRGSTSIANPSSEVPEILYSPPTITEDEEEDVIDVEVTASDGSSTTESIPVIIKKQPSFNSADLQAGKPLLVPFTTGFAGGFNVYYDPNTSLQTLTDLVNNNNITRSAVGKTAMDSVLKSTSINTTGLVPNGHRSDLTFSNASTSRDNFSVLRYYNKVQFGFGCGIRDGSFSDTYEYLPVGSFLSMYFIKDQSTPSDGFFYKVDSNTVDTAHSYTPSSSDFPFGHRQFPNFALTGSNNPQPRLTQVNNCVFTPPDGFYSFRMITALNVTSSSRLNVPHQDLLAAKIVAAEGFPTMKQIIPLGGEGSTALNINGSLNVSYTSNLYLRELNDMLSSLNRIDAITPVYTIRLASGKVVEKKLFRYAESRFGNRFIYPSDDNEIRGTG